MAVTAFMFGSALAALFNKEIDFVTDDVKVLLTTSAYTPAQDTHDYVSDVTNEVTGTGYTAEGQSLTGKAATYDAATNTLKLDADDVTWPASTITARRAVFYVDTGTPATSPLLCWWDFGADESSAAGTFTLSIAAAGLITAATA